ncbi:MAG: Gfo/Idh/MocA family protein [Tepidisphaerales bacterium]
MNSISRRRLLGTSATVAGAVALWSGGARAAESPANKVVLALIGAGGRGSAHLAGFLAVPGVEFKYICDVDYTRGESLVKLADKAQGRAPQRISDMRLIFDDKDVQGVIVATPDHWHALATVWACQAGKDVYVEKNASYSIWEGRKMIEAARKYKRIVQCGLQNRSAPYANTARQYIASGKLGKVVHVKVYNLNPGGAFRAQPDSQAPATLDWDKWIGPAAMVPYNVSRHRDWYSWYDYCGGELGNDGSHQLDLARNVLGDPPPPKHAHCAAGNYAFGSKRQTPEFQQVTYEFDDFVMTCSSGTFPAYLRKSNNEERNGSKFPLWSMNCERIEIYGTKQIMYVGRHGVGWQVMESDGKVVAEEKGVHPDKYHQPNFVDCIRSRKLPNADIEIAHGAALLAHLGNIAYRCGDLRVEFDPAAERFINCDAGNALVRQTMREKYRIPDEV